MATWGWPYAVFALKNLQIIIYTIMIITIIFIVVVILIIMRLFLLLRYYEAFPPLSEKSVCLQEIMTVWNKACTYSSSSSSAVPQTSTDTSAPKRRQHQRRGRFLRSKQLMHPVPQHHNQRRAQQRRTKREKENRFHGSATGVTGNQVLPRSKRQARHRSEGRLRPRSWVLWL